MEVRDSFGKALRFVRHRRGLAQEDFSLVSSRTFVSMLERGATSLGISTEWRAVVRTQPQRVSLSILG